MTKSQSKTATERRKQHKATMNKEKQRNYRKIRRKKNQKTWLILGSIAAAIVVIIGVFAFISKQNQPSIAGNTTRSAVDVTTLKDITHVDPTLLSQIGTGGIADKLEATQGSPSLLTGPTGKPELLYIGAEYCPYCAAERWPMIIALNRFGTFHNQGEATSISSDVYPSTPTFTFNGSSYTSPYLDFVPVETQDQQGNPLQTVTSDQQNLVNLYDAPPYVSQDSANGIPFIDIGNRCINPGASYDPGILRTNPKDPYSSPLTRQTIASQLSTTNTLSKQVLGAANYLTAAICATVNNQPSNVCSDPSIQHIEASLP